MAVRRCRLLFAVAVLALQKPLLSQPRAAFNDDSAGSPKSRLKSSFAGHKVKPAELDKPLIVTAITLPVNDLKGYQPQAGVTGSPLTAHQVLIKCILPNGLA